ncbi:MAG TPA: 50S ribosomal protein L18 [Candidatus Paceibacterota bacterium]|nr:50S ribosomal protein L18 [Candidatus Paceibacterota bacterium]
MNRKQLIKKRKRRAKRARAKIGPGTAERPRLSVFRSNRHIYAQLINDQEGETVVSASSFDVKGSTKLEEAGKVGKLIAKKAKKNDIEKIIFDKGSYDYHGRVKELAEKAREGGLKF